VWFSAPSNDAKAGRVDYSSLAKLSILECQEADRHFKRAVLLNSHNVQHEKSPTSSFCIEMLTYRVPFCEDCHPALVTLSTSAAVHTPVPQADMKALPTSKAAKVTRGFPKYHPMVRQGLPEDP
jgi:hypothetical protein